MKSAKFFLIILLGAILILPAQAAIVPCTTNCQVCDILKLVQNIINFFLQISVPLATAMFLAAGILILTAGDSTQRLELGKTIFKNAVIGFAIVLCAWLFINTILNVLAGQEFPMPWNKIQC